METKDDSSFHINLANYFAKMPLYLDLPTQKKPNTRKLVEQPWQHTKAAILEKDKENLWDNITNTLCNLDFIQAKASAKMTYDLVDDFNAVLAVIPDNEKNFREEKDRLAKMEKYTNDLILYAKGEQRELDIPQSVRLLTEQEIGKEIERIKTNQTRADRLTDFANFLGQEGHNLQNYAYRFAHFTLQLAWNYAGEGPVGKAADMHEPMATKLLLRLSPSTRPLWNPKPQTLKILKGHTEDVNAVAITPNGNWVLTGAEDKTCILWRSEERRVGKECRSRWSRYQ